MGNERRERLLLLVAILCIVFLVGDKFLVTPLLHLWLTRSERISVLEHSLNKGATLVDREENLALRRKDMNERSLMSKISDAENMVLNSVSGWAYTSSLNITSIKPRWIYDDADSKKLEFRLSATGNIESVVRFLYELESDSLAIRLEDVEISARDNRGRELALSLRFTGLILMEEKS